MTRAEVILKIANKTGIDKLDVQLTLDTFLKVIKESMIDGQNIYLRGFGSFVNKKRNRKIARNIKKNTAIIIDAHYIPSFKPAKDFVNKIKNSKKVKTYQ